MAKKRGSKNSKKKTSSKGKKKTKMSYKKKIMLSLNNLLFFAVLSILSFFLFKTAEEVAFQNLFSILAIILGAVSVSFLIVLLTVVFMKSFKK